MIQRQDFNKLFTSLLTYHGKKFNSEMASAWYSRLRSRSTAGVSRAFDEGKAAHRSMPTLNEVCTYLPRYEGSTADEKLILSPQEVAFNLAVWPHFSDMAARKIGKKEFGLAFKGLSVLHGMTNKLDMDAMSIACEIDLTDGR